MGTEKIWLERAILCHVYSIDVGAGVRLVSGWLMLGLRYVAGGIDWATAPASGCKKFRVKSFHAF
jgi:hypothetical protein